jgi:hypothetical protein
MGIEAGWIELSVTQSIERDRVSFHDYTLYDLWYNVQAYMMTLYVKFRLKSYCEAGLLWRSTATEKPSRMKVMYLQYAAQVYEIAEPSIQAIADAT